MMAPFSEKPPGNFFDRPSLIFLIGVNSYGIKKPKPGQQPTYVAVVKRLAAMISKEVSDDRPATLCYEASGAVASPGDPDFKYNLLVTDLLAETLAVEPQKSGSIRGLNGPSRRTTYEHCNAVTTIEGILVLVVCNDSMHWIITDLGRPQSFATAGGIDMLAINPRTT